MSRTLDWSTELEICQGKRVYSSWEKARSVMKSMLKDRGHRKVSIHIYRCDICKHFHIGSTITDMYTKNWKPGSKSRLRGSYAHSNDKERDIRSVSRREKEVS